MLRPTESDQCGVFLALCFCFFKISHGFGRKLLLFNSFYSSPSLEKSPLNLNFILFLPSFLLYYRENTLENVKHFPEQGKATMLLHLLGKKSHSSISWDIFNLNNVDISLLYLKWKLVTLWSCMWEKRNFLSCNLFSMTMNKGMRLSVFHWFFGKLALVTIIIN